ncbi:hypothetical protein TIFTF001_011912 [Ficus carica]|uniref:Uncharacterized protein n=1 Tax=Ficus carica TaxID=3494 RepID=A0AA88DHZ1_FICCA|nr:hypothetical protein TIFTF001_011912 [Ficus carica]
MGVLVGGGVEVGRGGSPGVGREEKRERGGKRGKEQGREKGGVGEASRGGGPGVGVGAVGWGAGD